MLSEGNGTGAAANDLSQKVLRKCRESVEIKERFFAQCADQIAELCEKMARQFQEGHKLWVMGNGGSACDAQHVAVEFVHPIIEKRKPLPAMALTLDTATLTAIGNDSDFSRVFEAQLELLARPEDCVLGIST